LNKQLGALNEKMQVSMGELRNQYKIEVDEERIDILAGVQTSHRPHLSALNDEEILERKKAWADLEREQTEVKRDIKSLMKTEPASRILVDDPALADRVNNTRLNPTNTTVERNNSQERAKPAETAPVLSAKKQAEIGS